MDQKVKLRHIRITPRKANIVAKVIRNKKVSEAVEILKFIPKAASPIMLRLIKSGVAAINRHPETDRDNLFIKELRADMGPILRNAKRFIPRAMGRASKIHVRTSHLTLIISDGKSNEKEEK